MFSSIFVASAQQFTQGTIDKHGLMPLILDGVLGEFPDRRVIAGTVAKNSGFEPGNIYLVKCQEVGPDENYGRQFNFTNLGKLSPMEVLQARKELGDPKMFAASSQGNAALRTELQKAQVAGEPDRLKRRERQTIEEGNDDGNSRDEAPE